MPKDYEIQNVSIDLMIAKAKHDNKHKKPRAMASAPALKANAKTITIWLSCKRPGTYQQAVTIKATVETDNLLVARIEAARAARGLGFADRDLLELDHKRHRC